jgi:tetratricopeptide (TPR) repeat protein
MPSPEEEGVLKQCLALARGIGLAGLALFSSMPPGLLAAEQEPNPNYQPTEARAVSGRVNSSPQQTGDLLPEADRIFRQAAEDFRAGRAADALARLKDGLKAYPDDPPMLHLAGLIHSNLGENQAAQLYLERAVKLWPDHPVYWINLGIFYMRSSRVAEAEKALLRSLRISPSPTAYSLMGLIRLDQNAGEKAVDFLKKSLDLTKDDVRSWYYLGLAHQSLAQNDSALTCYQEALRLAPRDFYTSLQLGKLYLKRGQRKDALKHLKIALEIRPDESELFRLLSEAFLGAGDLESALTWARRAADAKPDDPQSHYQLGLVLARMGRGEESSEAFRRSEQLPKKPEPSPLDRWREISLQASVSKGHECIG